jgi:glycine/D-amino acid oxidase-like deaminating enzyme
MLDTRSHGLWERTAPQSPTTTAFSGDLSVDVAVIGGGYTGLSSALHLAKQGAKVALLEAEEIGYGGSGRNVGLVNAGMWTAPDDISRILGPAFGEQLLEVLGNAPGLVFDLIEKYALKCEAVRNGSLQLAVGAAGIHEIEKRTEQWRRRGAAVRTMDAAETAMTVGTSVYEGAMRDDRAGTVQPLAYARELARAAQTEGAMLFTRSKVRSAERTGRRWQLRTDAGRLTSDWVIVGTNAYSGDLWPELRSEIVRLPFFQCATRPLGEGLLKRILPNREGAGDTQKVICSFRRDETGRLVFGSVGALRNGAAAVHRSYARRSLKRLFPEIARVEFEFEWYGWIAMTADHIPHFRELAPQVLNFNGYNGRGIGTGTVFGKILAERIADPLKKMPLPGKTPNGIGLRQLRSAYIEAGSAVAHMS